MLQALWMLPGFIFLVKGADLLVKGASMVAKRLGISSLVIGLTIVSFGTSLPELLVTVVSGVRQNADLAIANVVGSNIANVLLVLGIAAMIRPLPVQDSTVVSEIPFSLTAALLVGFLANAALFSTVPELTISRLDGGILLFFFFLFMVYVFNVSSAEPDKPGTEIDGPPPGRAIGSILVGVTLLWFGGGWVVDGAVSLAASLGVADALIGLTVVAIGTSMPELVASAVAAWRGESDIAVGNVVGSNIFNLLWVLGFTACIVELPFEAVTNTDLLMVIVSSALVILALVASRRATVLRVHGMLFILCYAGYLGYIIQRG